MNQCFLETFLEGADGVIVAGMGTGSIPNDIIEVLEKYTNKIPVVITTRCTTGQSFDDYYYKGSLKKYESKGFIINGFENLNPLQARIKLILQLSQ